MALRTPNTIGASACVLVLALFSWILTQDGSHAVDWRLNRTAFGQRGLQPKKQPRAVHNFSIHSDHVYFISKGSILSHNFSGIGGGSPGTPRILRTKMSKQVPKKLMNRKDLIMASPVHLQARKPKLIGYLPAQMIPSIQEFIGLHTEMKDAEIGFALEERVDPFGEPLERDLNWLVFREGTQAAVPFKHGEGVLLHVHPGFPFPSVNDVEILQQQIEQRELPDDSEAATVAGSLGEEEDAVIVLYSKYTRVFDYREPVADSSMPWGTLYGSYVNVRILSEELVGYDVREIRPSVEKGRLIFLGPDGNEAHASHFDRVEIGQVNDGENSFIYYVPVN